MLEHDLGFLEQLGIEFQGNRRLGRDLDPRTLREFGYDAVLLAIGTPLSKHIDIAGKDLNGVLWGVDYLRDADTEQQQKLNGNVLVVGGGGVAMDCAMSALRSGAETVEILSLEQADELPAHPNEVADAKEEGIVFSHGWGPSEFRGEDGQLKETVFVRCNKVYDDQGRFAPEYSLNAHITRDADWVILAVGVEADSTVFGPEGGQMLGKKGLLSPDSEAVETWLPGFFGAGDFVHGPSSVVEAIASGKRAASGIDRFLGGDGELEIITLDTEIFDGTSISLEEHQPTAKRDVESRTDDFDIIKLTLDPVQAAAEANRCLRCNIRHQIKAPILPPELWRPLNEALLSEVPAESGVCMLADSSGQVLKISGNESIRACLSEWLIDADEATINKVQWVVDPMYTKRESELIQQHIQKHGEMPAGDDELDDLF
ncbi:glutamate synthase [NADPH] small chain [bacterium BMS3Bbin04]|nr:glutamate synthase [NADPH] small chain [bacterium BMS3Bbin04]